MLVTLEEPGGSDIGEVIHVLLARFVDHFASGFYLQVCLLPGSSVSNDQVTSAAEADEILFVQFPVGCDMKRNDVVCFQTVSLTGSTAALALGMEFHKCGAKLPPAWGSFSALWRFALDPTEKIVDVHVSLVTSQIRNGPIQTETYTTSKSVECLIEFPRSRLVPEPQPTSFQECGNIPLQARTLFRVARISEPCT